MYPSIKAMMNYISGGNRVIDVIALSVFIIASIISTAAIYILIRDFIFFIFDIL